MLDLTDFVQLRDVVAILTLHQTGIRLGTVSQLRNKHIDIKVMLLRIDGGQIKNYESLILPFDDVLTRLFTVLLAQNDAVRKSNVVRNDFVFITQTGGQVAAHRTNHILTRRLNKYKREFGLKNMALHALRLGFAKWLYDQGAHIAVISKVLGHSDIAVTMRYLHLETEEVAEVLRKHL